MESKAKRITRNYCQQINSTPQIIFPLLCPERETEWLDGWDYTMVYSKTGIAEDGAVFTTSQDGEEDTVWIITNHDKENYVVEFARVTPKSRASTLKIKLNRKDAKSSFVDITYSYTSLSHEGNEFINGFSEEEFLKIMNFWEKSMNHFLETGKKLKKK